MLHSQRKEEFQFNRSDIPHSFPSSFGQFEQPCQISHRHTIPHHPTPVAIPSFPDSTVRYKERNMPFSIESILGISNSASKDQCCQNVCRCSNLHNKCSYCRRCCKECSNLSATFQKKLTFSSPDKVLRTAQRRPSRAVFPQDKVHLMDQYYRQYRYLSAEQREDIASAVSLSPTQVKRWWQNRRCKEKAKTRDNEQKCWTTSLGSYNPATSPLPHFNTESERSSKLQYALSGPNMNNRRTTMLPEMGLFQILSALNNR